MGFSSQDAMVNAITTLGQTWIQPWNKNALPTTAQTAGQWYDLAKGAGNPATDAIIGSGTNLTFQAVTDTVAPTAASGALGGNITTTVFTDTTHGSGNFTVGMTLTGTGITAGTMIVSLGTGTGQNSGGTYNINISQSVTSQTITGTANANFIQHGGNVSTATKHILNVSAYSAAPTTAPCILQLVDILAVIPITTVTLTTAQTILGTQTLPRYANGKGVQAYLAPSVVMGAGTPTVQFNYTNPSSVSGRLTPTAPSLPVVNSASPVGAIAYAGTGVGKYGPFMPLAAGDNGILSIQSVQFSATMTSGTMNIVFCKPLLTLPITTVGVAAERDLINQLPSLPQVFDGACLNWLMYAGAATPVNSSFFGQIQTAWA